MPDALRLHASYLENINRACQFGNHAGSWTPLLSQSFPVPRKGIFKGLIPAPKHHGLQSGFETRRVWSPASSFVKPGRTPWFWYLRETGKTGWKYAFPHFPAFRKRNIPIAVVFNACLSEHTDIPALIISSVYTYKYSCTSRRKCMSGQKPWFAHFQIFRFLHIPIFKAQKAQTFR